MEQREFLTWVGEPIPAWDGACPGAGVGESGRYSDSADTGETISLWDQQRDHTIAFKWWVFTTSQKGEVGKGFQVK